MRPGLGGDGGDEQEPERERRSSWCRGQSAEGEDSDDDRCGGAGQGRNVRKRMHEGVVLLV